MDIIQKSNKLYLESEEKLHQVEIEQDDMIKRTESAIMLGKEYFKKLKQIILTSKFKNIKQEIQFFKEIKPKFLSKLIYYVKVYNIESKRPTGSYKAQKAYFECELDRLKRYCDTYLEFYQYYRTNSTFLDDKYFVRGKHDIRLTPDAFFFETDPRFSTSHDYKISKIIANDLLEVYLKYEIAAIESKESSQEKLTPFSGTKLTWTASKVSLIELIYSLQAAGSFNNSNASIKEIASYFEAAFDIELGDYYRKYLEIKSRKNQQTKFLDLLKDSFVKKISEDF